ncbi:MAG: DUF1015 domain-containing protein [bacterium]|nr:DUF1015 domain-containing protein [bacterium]
MAEVKPFVGLIYNKDIVDKLEDVISPPYDIISPELQRNLYNRHLYNIVRLELPLGNGEEKYLEAGKTLRLWLENKILVPSKKPSYYFYEEIYTLDKEERILRGFFGIVKVEPFEKRVILPHEFTFPKPKEDRFNLLKYIKSNVSPILGMYFDEVGISKELWEHVKLEEPLFSSDRFKIWVVDDVLEDISNFFRDRTILIADGHHRYETALKYRELMELEYGKFGPYSYVMMFLVDAYSGGLSLLPTHRIIKGVSKDFEDMLKNSFLLEKTDLIEITQDEHLVYYYKKGEAFKFRTKELNVASLHEFLSKFDNLSITYSHSIEEVKSLVDRGTYESAFIVNPPSMDTLRCIVEKGDRLPQKTTYFYPKIGAGLVIYNHNLNEREMSWDA